MRKFKNRRGAMLVLAAVFILMVLSFLAFVSDITRIYVQKNELHTAADAAALAAVMELNSNPASVDDSANAFSLKNLVFKNARPALAADVTCQIYNITTDVLSNSGACDITKNAVTVTVRDSAAWAFPLLFARSGKEVTATSTAFLAFIGPTKCVKPWGVPLVLFNTLLDPSNPDQIRTVMTAYDLQQLQTLTRDQLRFQLKSGSPPNDPGNFGALNLPNPNSNGNGAKKYQDNIETCNPLYLGADSVVDTEPGNMVGPTTKGAAVLCQPLVGEECQDGNGNMGLTVYAPLWYEPGKINGRTAVTIKGIVAFSLDSVTSSAEVIGHFLPDLGGGIITPAPSTIKRPILVR